MRKIVVLNKMSDPLTYETSLFFGISDVELVKSAAVTEDEIISDCQDAEVILFTSARLTRRVLESLKATKLIVRYGIGYDTVDTECAKECGIYVCNSPNYGVVDVAEHAFSLMLASSKRLVAMNDRVRANNWGFDNMGESVRMSGKRFGFVGFGKIARKVADMLMPFVGDAPILVYDPYVKDEDLLKYGAHSVTLDTLLAESDFITLHLPLTDSTRHIIGKRELDLMKPNAVIVNTSRGPIIDESALLLALMSHSIGGAGLDVFEDETGGIDPRFFTLDNAVLTPHVAWNTTEAAFAVHVEVAENVKKYLLGGRPDSIVNGL